VQHYCSLLPPPEAPTHDKNSDRIPKESIGLSCKHGNVSKIMMLLLQFRLMMMILNGVLGPQDMALYQARKLPIKERA